MLHASNIWFTYPAAPAPTAAADAAAAAVHGVTLDVPRGGLVGLLGPNGSGKTTLVRLLAGTLRPDAGRVTLKGIDLEQQSRAAIARQVAVVPQETHLAFDYSVLEVALMGRHPHLGRFALEGPADVAIARESLAATGTAALERRPFATLSGGEKQRVIIASALAQAAGLMLLDEPTASLDLGYQLDIAALLARLNRERGITMVLATHDLALAARLCRDLVLIRDGRLLASGPIETVLTSAAVADLYGVEAEVRRNQSSGQLTVVPLKRLPPEGRPEGPPTQVRAGLKPGPYDDRPPVVPLPETREPGAQSRVSPVRARLLLTLALFGSVALAAVLLAPLVGSTRLSLARAFSRSIPFTRNVDAQIFFVARLPRTLAGALVGAALAAAGVVFQALLRNPLATPFTLGVSAGAALGAMLVITFPLQLALAGVATVPLASFAGSLGAVAIVYALATARRRGLSTDVLLLAGVTLNAFFSALILFVQYFADFSQTFRTVRWLMGNLDLAEYAAILGALPLTVIALVAFAWLPRSLNLLALGPDAAATRGVDVVGAQRLAFFSASLATGAAVSLAGPIGFIGIVVPHLVRLLVGADHRIVLPASALFGAAFLIACDVVARSLIAPMELPVGIVTAIIGGPFFLWLLIRRA